MFGIDMFIFQEHTCEIKPVSSILDSVSSTVRNVLDRVTSASTVTSVLDRNEASCSSTSFSNVLDLSTGQFPVLSFFNTLLFLYSQPLPMIIHNFALISL